MVTITFTLSKSYIKKIVYSVVEMSLAGINYFMDDWRLIYGIFIAGPAVIAFFSSFSLKETPSFYSAKK